MRAISRFLSLAALLVPLALSASDGLDTDLMQSIEDTNKSLSSHIAVKETPDALADAKSLQAMFDQVESYYQGKGDAPDAVSLAQKSKALSQQIQQLLSASDFDGATDAATQLSRTCKTCHNFYKKS